jgi:hypothetical protein
MILMKKTWMISTLNHSKIPNSNEHYKEWDSLSKLEDVYNKLTEDDE